MNQRCRSCSLGEADAAVHLGGGAHDRGADLGEMRLGVGRQQRRLVGPRVEGMRGVPHQRPRRLELRDHLRAQVLHGLERRDRAAELLALLRVGDGHLDRALAGAERVGRDRDAAGVEHAIDERRGAVDRSARPPTPSKPSSATRRVRSIVASGVTVSPGRVARHERDAVAPERDQKNACGAGIDREERAAVDAIAVRAQAGVAALRDRLAQRRAEHDLARRDARQPLRLLRGACRRASATGASTPVARNGAGVAAWPSDCATSAASSSASPLPPCASGTSTPSDAELGEGGPQRRVVRRCRLSMISRTRAVGTDSAR